MATLFQLCFFYLIVQIVSETPPRGEPGLPGPVPPVPAVCPDMEEGDAQYNRVPPYMARVGYPDTVGPNISSYFYGGKIRELFGKCATQMTLYEVLRDHLRELDYRRMVCKDNKFIIPNYRPARIRI